ncbi:RNA polymerase subunit sigma [Arthrobacter sp. SW1]|uniref:RNA polymerase sigma factor n=1 Tax=Arthrobacter sp. SW1 TaxID=1920889 RepID=UPI000877C011|nr:RNA polymerase sigma factor [Arthrobacter sp. SW1]OFI36462.1 RNA polymerase subunit sigma [Arthrobacter sp. SW1]
MGKPPFEKVVAAHGAVVLRVCRAVLGAHDAEDAWSETFLSALKAYPELPDDANLQAWLVTIAHRKAIDVLRIRQRQAVPLDELPARESPLGNPGDGHPEVLDAVGQLPPKQRQAVAYHYLAGLPYKEISTLLGVTPEAARRAGADGVKALRAVLTETGSPASKGALP